MTSHKVVSDYTNVVESASLKVYVRARPLENPADANGKFCQINEGDEKFISIKDPDETRQKYGEVNFNFDRIFWTSASQEEVFEAACKSQVDHIMNGINSCCFAYGQTGSGKTHTMFGGEGEMRGMIPRSVEYLFEQIAEKSEKFDVAVFSTFIEIYNDQIRDLGKAYLVATGIESCTSNAMLEKTSDIFESLEQKRNQSYFGPAFRKNLRGSKDNASPATGSLKDVQDEYKEIHFEIYEDAEGNVFVKDISIIPVLNEEEVFSVMEQGLKLRATHETKMNTVSSRSHCVFSLTVVQRDTSTGDTIKGTINLVDLAGSERVKKSESVGNRLREALHINTSLTALGKVIMALDPSSDATHIPYRDSKLTRILQNTLSGNSFTTLLATIHPSPLYFEECLSTLQFANRCRNVRNHPRVNYVGESEDKDKKIKRLLEEIGQLRMKLSLYEGQGGAGLRKGGKGLSAAAAFTPAKLIAVLQKLGLKAEIGANGEIILDGKVVSAEALGLSEVFAAAAEAGDWSDDMDPKNSRYFKELQKDNETYKRRNRDQKDYIDKLELEREGMKEKLATKNTDLRTIQTDYKMMVGQYERTLEILKSNMQQDQERKLHELIEHNQYLMNQHNVLQSTLQQSTLSPKAPLEGLHLKATKSMEYVAKQEYLANIEAIQASRDEDIQLIKQQYADLLYQKEIDMQNELDELSSEREKNKKTVKACEKEIIQLYGYIVGLERFVQDLERIAAPPNAFVHGAPNTFGLPEHLVNDKDASPLFALTHRIASSYKKRGRLQDLLATAGAVSGGSSGYNNTGDDSGIYEALHSPVVLAEEESTRMERASYVDRIKELRSPNRTPPPSVRPQSAVTSSNRGKQPHIIISERPASSSGPIRGLSAGNYENQSVIEIGEYTRAGRRDVPDKLLARVVARKGKLQFTMPPERVTESKEMSALIDQMDELKVEKEKLSTQLRQANANYQNVKIANSSLMRAVEKSRK